MFEQFKNILFDLFLVYKNFIHWNISKILIFIFGLSLGIILSLPFFIILALFMYFDQINWKDVILNYISSGGLIGMSLMSEFYNNFIILIIEGIILFFAIIAFILGFSYKNLTIINLYLSYLKGERMEYMKNIYFNIKIIFSYIKLLSIIVGILAIPIIIFITIFITLIINFGGIDNVLNILENSGGKNMFSILLGISFLVCLSIFIYLAYRISFSYIILLDKDNYIEENKTFFYIKESLKITSGLKIFKFLFLIILFIIFMIPFDYLSNIIKGYNQIIILIYSFIMFLLIEGLFEMYIVSIYKRVMINSKEKININ